MPSLLTFAGISGFSSKTDALAVKLRGVAYDEPEIPRILSFARVFAELCQAASRDPLETLDAVLPGILAGQAGLVWLSENGKKVAP